MRPYFEAPGVTLYHADYAAVLSSLEPVDVIITDPPYGETACDWDRAPETEWLSNLGPVLAPTGSIWTFGSLRYFAGLLRTKQWSIAQDIVWEKHNGSSFHADRFKRVHELVVQLIPAAMGRRL